ALGQGPIADPRLRVAVHRLYASELRVGLVSDGAEQQALLFGAEHPVMAVLIDRVEGSRIVREYGAILGNDLATKFVERNLGSIHHLEEAELSTVLAPGIRVGAWHEEARDEERRCVLRCRARRRIEKAPLLWRAAEPGHEAFSDALCVVVRVPVV